MKEINKIIAAVALGGIIIGGIVFGIMDRIHRRNTNSITQVYNAQMAAIQYQRDSLEHHADSIDFVLAQKQAKFDSLQKVDKYHQSEIERLRMELLGVLNDMFDDLTEEAHYQALQKMFPTKDSLVFPFSGDQVKKIHIAVVAGQYKDSLIVEYQLADKVLRAQIATTLSQIDVLSIEKQDLRYLADKLYKQLAVKTEENKLTAEELEDLKKQLRRMKAGGAVGVLGVIAILLLI